MDILEKEKIFNDIYNRKIKAVKWYCKRCAGLEEAEELSHEIFISFYNNFEKFEGKSKLDTWLYSITKNTCINFMRNKNANKRKGIVYSLDAPTQYETFDDMSLDVSRRTKAYSRELWIEDKKINFVDDSINKETLFIVKREIENIDEPFRECLLAFMEPDGFCSYEEAAKKLGVSKNTAGSRLVRAKNILKKKMKKHGSII